MKRTLKLPVLCALVPFLLTGIYGVVIGVQSSLAYLSTTTCPVSAGSAIYAVFLGCLRGVLVLLCVALCARAVWRDRVGLRHAVFPAVLACLYVLSLIDPPCTAADILEACTAVLATGGMAFLLLRTRSAAGKPAVS